MKCSSTAVLATTSAAGRPSTGIEALDSVLGGLFWGDNVVWELDAAPVAPFYRAIAGQDGLFDTKTVVSLGHAVNTYGVPGLTVIDAGPGSPLALPADVLHEIHRRCRTRGRRLLLFGPLEAMVDSWGAAATREFFARCCPLLLELGVVAYWALSPRAVPAGVRKTVEVVTQCVLRVDQRTVRVVKAEGRDDDAGGAVLHWHETGGLPVLSPPELAGRVAASLRALRRTHELSQHDLGELAGVTASAISQAERAERGLSLATLVRLSGALHVTVDDLLHGGGRDAYQIGRRADEPDGALVHALTPLADRADVHVDLVRLGARESGAPTGRPTGRGIVAVAGGLVQVVLAEQAPTLRHGEVLITDAARVTAWRNLGQAEASLFWMVSSFGA